MSRRKKAVVIVGLSVLGILVGLIALGLLVGPPDGRGGPSYKGVPLGLWLVQLRYEDPEGRAEALEALNSMGQPAAKAVLAGLEAPNERVQSSSAWALGQLKDAPPGAVDALKRLGEKASPEVRDAVQAALNRLEGGAQRRPATQPAGDAPSVSAAVEALLAHRTDRCVQMAEVLMGRGDSRVVPAIIQVLREEDKTFRFSALEALGRLGDKRAVPHILPALQAKDQSVRREAAEALSRLGDKRAVPHMISDLQSEERRVRNGAIQALGRLRDPRAVAPLVALVENPKVSSIVQLGALQALGQIGDEAALPVLLENLESGPYDRDLAVAVGGIGAPAVPALLELLAKNDKRAPAVLLALGATGDPAAIAAVTKVVQPEDSPHRHKAAEALGLSGDASVIPALAKVLDDRRAYTREVALRSLSELGEPALPALIKATGSEHSEIREKAAEMLKDMTKKDHSYVPLFAEALADENTHVRWYAADMLGNIGHKSAVPALTGALQDKAWGVQAIAAFSLSRIPHYTAYRALVEAMETTNNAKVRYYAFWKLGEVGDPYALPTLMKFLRTKIKDGYAFDLDVEKALIKIAGVRFGGRPDKRYAKWEEWWEKHKR